MENNTIFRNFPGLKTDRLVIRKLTANDAEAIFEFTSKKETSDFLTWEPHVDIRVTRDFISALLKKYRNNEASQWGLELGAEGKIIGIAGFISYFPEHLKGEVAYVLSPAYWNKGYMTEALSEIIRFGFVNMKLNRIEAKCEIDNFGSERVLQRCGMKCEGVSYSYLIRKNIPRDYKFYCKLAKQC
jgi:ribosomal-protein-alanine N-acetyltransferase